MEGADKRKHNNHWRINCDGTRLAYEEGVFLKRVQHLWAAPRPLRRKEAVCVTKWAAVCLVFVSFVFDCVLEMHSFVLRTSLESI